jgi:allantoate deiminase
MTAPLPNARRIMERCDALARHSEDSNALTRVFLSPQHRSAAKDVMDWMQAAGMSASLDAIGNVVGRYEAAAPNAPCLLLGSHLDTVRNAGRYDGMLGVVTAIECVQAFQEAKRRFPFAIEIAGFGDEEGVRFGTTLLGSRAMAGRFERNDLSTRDRDGLSMADAMRAFGLDESRLGEAAKRREQILAYVELHIEQGPVLESLALPVGVVTAINGFSRLRVTLSGMAGHAGTVPMHLRRDALAAAAECVLVVENVARSTPDLVGTVGKMEVAPGAINVIPGESTFTLDIRAPDDAVRERAVHTILSEIERISRQRGLTAKVERLQSQNVTRCAPWLMTQMATAVTEQGYRVHELPSGAGHDGMAMQAIADIAMLFLRCKAGISHHPDESITLEDAAVGARTLHHFIEHFQSP